jgi:hypothetical protein
MTTPYAQRASLPKAPNPTVRTPLGNAPVIPLAIIGIGAYITWFGVHYWRSSVKWPTDPIKAVLTGKGMPDPATGKTSEATVEADITASEAGAPANAAEQENTGQNQTSVSQVSGDTGKEQPGVSTGTTGIATYGQIKDWWIAAGGPPGVAAIAAAITEPESGRDVTAVQAGEPYATTGWGLWQITPGNSEPQAGTDQQLLTGPTNARAAVAKYEQAGNSFRPWTTYVAGKYIPFLQAAQQG